MKLSDIDNMKKLAEEWKKSNDFMCAIARRSLGDVSIVFTDHNSNTKYELRVAKYNTEPLPFLHSVQDAVKERLDLLRTKLVMMGVEEFDGEFKE